MRVLFTVTVLVLAGCGPRGIHLGGTCGDYALMAPASAVNEPDLHEKCQLDGTNAVANWDVGPTTNAFFPDSHDLTATITANFPNEDLVEGQTIVIRNDADGQALIGTEASPSDVATLTGGTLHVLKAGRAGVTDADGSTVDYWKMDWDITWGDPSGDGPWYTATGEDWMAVHQFSTTTYYGSSGSYYYYYYYYY